MSARFSYNKLCPNEYEGEKKWKREVGDGFYRRGGVALAQRIRSQGFDDWRIIVGPTILRSRGEATDSPRNVDFDGFKSTICISFPLLPTWSSSATMLRPHISRLSARIQRLAKLHPARAFSATSSRGAEVELTIGQSLSVFVGPILLIGG